MGERGSGGGGLDALFICDGFLAKKTAPSVSPTATTLYSDPNPMPREIITLQTGQCGNQSEYSRAEGGKACLNRVFFRPQSGWSSGRSSAPSMGSAATAPSRSLPPRAET